MVFDLKKKLKQWRSLSAMVLVMSAVVLGTSPAMASPGDDVVKFVGDNAIAIANSPSSLYVAGLKVPIPQINTTVICNAALVPIKALPFGGTALQILDTVGKYPLYECRPSLKTVVIELAASKGVRLPADADAEMIKGLAVQLANNATLAASYVNNNSGTIINIVKDESEKAARNAPAALLKYGENLGKNVLGQGEVFVNAAYDSSRTAVNDAAKYLGLVKNNVRLEAPDFGAGIHWVPAHETCEGGGLDPLQTAGPYPVSICRINVDGFVKAGWVDGNMGCMTRNGDHAHGVTFGQFDRLCKKKTSANGVWLAKKSADSSCATTCTNKNLVAVASGRGDDRHRDLGSSLICSASHASANPPNRHFPGWTAETNRFTDHCQIALGGVGHVVVGGEGVVCLCGATNDILKPTPESIAKDEAAKKAAIAAKAFADAVAKAMAEAPRPAAAAANARTPLYVYFHQQARKHLYSTDAAEIGVTSGGQTGKYGYTSAGTGNVGYLLTAPVNGAVPVYRYLMNQPGGTSRVLITGLAGVGRTAANYQSDVGNGYIFESIVGYMPLTQQPGTVALYQYTWTQGPQDNTRFYQTKQDAPNPGFNLDGVLGYIFTNPTP